MSLSKMPHCTVMYSVNEETGLVVKHKLPYKRDSAQLETYTRKGFTFERPPEAVMPSFEQAVKATIGEMVAAKIDSQIMAKPKHAGGRPRKRKVKG